GHLRPTLSRPRRKMANLDRSWSRAGLESQRPGVVLRQQRQNDGCGRSDTAKFFGWETKDAVLLGTLSAEFQWVPILRCISRRPAIFDDQAKRRSCGADAKRSGAERVRRIEASRAHGQRSDDRPDQALLTHPRKAYSRRQQ